MLVKGDFVRPTAKLQTMAEDCEKLHTTRTITRLLFCTNLPEVKFPAQGEIESRAEHTLVAEFTVEITVESRNVAVRKQTFPVSGIWLLPVHITVRRSCSFKEGMRQR